MGKSPEGCRGAGVSGASTSLSGAPSATCWRVIAATALSALLALFAPAAAETPAAAPGLKVLGDELAVFSGGGLRLYTSARTVGSAHSNDSVILGESAEIDGDLTLVGMLAIHLNGSLTTLEADDVGTQAAPTGILAKTAASVTGTVTWVDPQPLPQIPTETEARALADRVFEQDMVFTEGRIDDVVFVAGTVRLAGSVAGTGTILATGSIVIDPLDPRPFQPPAYPLRIDLVSFQDVTIAEPTQVAGTVLAGGDVVVEVGATYFGRVRTHGTVLLKAGSTVDFETFPDTTPPEVTAMVPADGALLPTAQTEISADFIDDLSGVDTDSVVLTVDGVDRTAEATVTTERVVLSAGPILSEGAHAIELTVPDGVGNTTVAAWSFLVDTVPPTLTFTAPTEDPILNDPAPRIGLAFEDATSGVDTATLQVLVDGAPITERCTVATTEAFCAPPELPYALHTVSGEIRDRAGHPAVASLSFETRQDLLGPEVSLLTPLDGALLPDGTVQVTGTASDDGGLATLHVNGESVPVEDGTFSLTVELPEGTSLLQATAEDQTGKVGFAAAVVTVDETPPTIRLDELPSALTNAPTAQVSGEVLDASPIQSLTIAGEAVGLTDGRFSHELTLAPGQNTVQVEATDAAGHVGHAQVPLEYLPLPAIEITQPLDLATLTTTTVQVAGAVDDATATVDVNGVPATVLSDGRFIADGVPLVEGGNVLAATVRSPAGIVNTATVHVVRDLTAPHVAIASPMDGSVVMADRVAVSGLVNDIVAGTVNAQEATVTVNGVAAIIRNRNFLAAEISLAPGENLLTATGIDESGNVAEATIRITREAPGPDPRLHQVSGDLQEASATTPLPQPLVVTVLSGDGVPLGGRTVVFEEESGGGHLDGGRRRIAVTTDAQGLAQATWTLGRRAGVQRVRASAVGVLQPVDFTALAGPRAPAVLVVDAGDQQLGTAGHRLPRPFIATVTDDGFNRLGGVPVEFTLVKGEGHFGAGQSSIVVETDSDGRAVATLTLDPREGIANNAVAARIVGLPESPLASFTATGLAAGPADATAITGVVLDNTSRPISGVTVRVDDTALWTTTDEAGQFRIEPAPVGDVLLIVDGSTTERPGVWASLEFRMTSIAGRDNDLGMPIFLLPLDVSSGLYVDEVTGGIVTAPDVPGLTLEVAPGSVTFPGGSKSGIVSITTVHSDRVPMVPNFGQQPRLIVTIQPAGARFDPPARITYPNVEGLAPGESTDLYSFDHDLGHFVSIGPGTVSDDGTLLVSDPGVGILKAGWHCGGDPQSATGAAHDCPECLTCVGTTCVNDDGAACDDRDECTVMDRCNGGRCAAEAVFIRGVDALADGVKNLEAKAGEDIQFEPGSQVTTNCPEPLSYEWDFGDGMRSTLPRPIHAFRKEGSYAVELQVRCPSCDQATQRSVVNVKVKCPVPTDFRTKEARPEPGGILFFRYDWRSSTGDLQDLDLCEVGEQVVYPGGSPFMWPPPWQFSTPNPSVLRGDATAGFLTDAHSPGNFLLPYQVASFTAQQRYFYVCDCLADPSKPNILAGIFDIVREVTQRPDGRFQYIITKDGVTATIDPLP